MQRYLAHIVISEIFDNTPTANVLVVDQVGGVMYGTDCDASFTKVSQASHPR